nr:DUF937 domain-containing protein [uncultured Sphingomonas sp.]
MDILNSLIESGGADAIASQLGIDPATAKAGMGALLPAVLGGVQQQAQASSGAEGSLSAILAGLGGGGLLANVLGQEPTNINQGNEILGQIFGSKDVSRNVAAEASQQSGVSSDLLKKMLPIVAMMVAGYLMNKRGNVGGGQQSGVGGSILGGIAGSVLGGMLGGSSNGSNPFGSILDGLTRK